MKWLANGRPNQGSWYLYDWYCKAMTIALAPHVERRLRTLAEGHHLSIEAFIEQLVEREDPGFLNEQVSPRAGSLVELFADSPLRGSGIVIERDQSPDCTIRHGRLHRLT